MAELIRKTESTYAGWWLIDKEALDSLDDILDDQAKRLEDHRKKEISAAVRREQDRDRVRRARTGSEPPDDGEIRKRVESEHPAVVRVITLTLSSGHKIRAESFREAATDGNCRDQKVKKIEVGLRCGDIRGDLVVPASDKYQSLTIITLPEASNQAYELFVQLEMWADQRKPGLLRQIQSAQFPLPVVFAASLIFLVTMIGIFSGLLPTKNGWRAEARKLVAKGVKPEDQGRALELLLRRSAALDDDIDISRLPLWYKVAGVSTLAIGVLYSFGVSTAFEIGKGAASVRSQKWYASFLWKTVFGLLLLDVLVPMFSTKLLELIWTK